MEWIVPFELKLKDNMMILQGIRPVDSTFVIVDIDEKSLSEIGQWPWPRDQVAQLINQLADLDVGMIGLDVVFAEADNSSPQRIFDRLGLSTEIELPDFDIMLAEAVANTPTILGYVFIQNPDPLPPGLAPASRAIIVERNKPDISYLFKPYRAVLNIPAVQNAAFSSGYFNTLPDQDGLVRSIPLVMEYDGILYPSLSLEMMRIALGESRLTIDYEAHGVDAIYLGDIRIPTDPFGRMAVNFRGPAFQYHYISASDIMFQRVDKSDLMGKVVLIGTSAAGLLDLRATPFDSVYPGVEVHATAMDNILNEDFLAKPMWVLGVDLVSLVILGILVALLLLMLGSVMSFLLASILLALVWFGHYYAFTQGLLLNTLMPLMLIFLLFTFGTLLNYFFESKQKALIKARFAQKVSPAVVEELINHADDLVLEGKQLEVTIFFSDIRGFTSLSEAMGSPQSLIELLNRYMTPMVDVITARQGTVDKFIGDAIMAYWNAPIQIKDHADQALKASIEQILALDTLNQQLKAEDLPQIEIGIGLNTGLAVVGEMGSVGRSDYTCIGDSVNLASRAEGLCKPYAAHIVLTEFTLAALSNCELYKIRFLDKVRVKGKAQPVAVYECFGLENQAWYAYPVEEKMAYEAAQKLYHQADFQQALQSFEQLQSDYPQALYAMYIQRCQHYLQNPPDSFDGVFTLTTK
ncbi:adenylate/guanylate cyclase domain-containing protein [Thiomicrospira microaerophila]|nr:adenylate/guanylate cyclase domain-containing protein [Thiomicrospira microaerophila]UQB42670.1 adenylate/guanylate cyclase domain-containing protein [Thiomicrospira microaerophila]